MNFPSLSPASWMLFLLVTFMFFYGIGNWDIYILDEAKNAEAAREMWESKDWIVPLFNGELRFDKPPLHYYFMALSFWMFDVNPFSARFFSAFMGCLVAFSIFFKVKSRLGERRAFWATLLFISSVHVQLQFKLAVPDPFLIGFLTLSFFCLESWLRSKSSYSLRFAYFFLALATLSKGPIAILLVLLTLIIYNWIGPKPYRLSWIKLLEPYSLLIFTIITLPWYVLVTWATEGAWLQEFLFHHNLNRFTSTMEGHGGAFYLPLVFVIVGFLPSSLFLLQFFNQRFRNFKFDPLLGISSIFVMVTLVFFSISSTKLPNYIAPTYPFLAVMGAYAMHIRGRAKRIKSYAIGFTALVPIAFLGLWFDLLPNLPELKGVGQFAIFWLVPAALGICTLILLVLKKYSTSLFSLCLAFLYLNFLFVHAIIPSINSYNPVRLSKNIWSGKNLSYWGEYNPAFPFASEQIIPIWTSKISNDNLIITTNRALEREKFPMDYEILFQSKDLFEKTETMIIRSISAEE